MINMNECFVKSFETDTRNREWKTVFGKAAAGGENRAGQVKTGKGNRTDPVKTGKGNRTDPVKTRKENRTDTAKKNNDMKQNEKGPHPEGCGPRNIGVAKGNESAD